MDEGETRLFVGIKISPRLQRKLDNRARGTEHYFIENQPESLQIVTLEEDKLIGRFLNFIKDLLGSLEILLVRLLTLFHVKRIMLK